MGKSRDWNVDLIPKFLMSNGMFEALTFSSGVTFACDANLTFQLPNVQEVKLPRGIIVLRRKLCFFCLYFQVSWPVCC